MINEIKGVKEQGELESKAREIIGVEMKIGAVKRVDAGKREEVRKELGRIVGG